MNEGDTASTLADIKTENKKIEPNARTRYSEVIDRINNSKERLLLKAGEFEEVLLKIARRKDAETMRSFFDAYYAYRTRTSSNDDKADEIRKDALWQTDSTAALADARRSGKEDLLMVYGNPYRPLSETQKFFRESVNYHPVEPRRRLK